MKLFLLIIALLVCLPSTVAAQDFDQFEKFRDEALAHYAAKNYPKAIASFRKAHAIIPNAVLLYNVASAHAKMGNYAEAITASEQAKQHDGMDEKTALSNESRIRAFEVRVQAQEASADFKEQIAILAAKDTSFIEEPNTPTNEGSFGAIGWTGVVLTTVGAGAIAWGSFVAYDVDKNIPFYEDAARDGNRAEYDRLKSEIGDAQTQGQIALFGGIGLATVGLALTIYDLTNDSSESNATWFVAPSKQAVTVGFSSKF